MNVTNALVSPSIAGEIIEGTGLTTARILEILLAKNEQFRQALEGAKVSQTMAKDICAGNGYCSLILKVSVRFDEPDKAAYVFILKIPNRAGLSAVLGAKEGSKEELVSLRIKSQYVVHNTLGSSCQ